MHSPVNHRVHALCFPTLGIFHKPVSSPRLLRYVWAVCRELYNDVSRRYEGAEERRAAY